MKKIKRYMYLALFIFLSIFMTIENFNSLERDNVMLNEAQREIMNTTKDKYSLMEELSNEIYIKTGSVKISEKLQKEKQDYAFANLDLINIVKINNSLDEVHYLAMITLNAEGIYENPDIKEICKRLESTEEELIELKASYNAKVARYNMKFTKFPRSMISGLQGFRTKLSY